MVLQFAAGYCGAEFEGKDHFALKVVRGIGGASVLRLLFPKTAGSEDRETPKTREDAVLNVK
ncbi:hypothetical protein E4U56_000636 [Claviceps arundinis]|uniref:Uncharacterized protein n=1 Tax=Claviceps arundinis TaxID=1623583 RepID=A0A9P7SNE5_9HYPO|nr:hypothetical protein E4U56_000636 [Claviceps arundinis]